MDGKLIAISGLKLLRNWIQMRYDRKLDGISGQDATVEVTDGR